MMVAHIGFEPGYKSQEHVKAMTGGTPFYLTMPMSVAEARAFGDDGDQ